MSFRVRFFVGGLSICAQPQVGALSTCAQPQNLEIGNPKRVRICQYTPQRNH